MKSHKMSSMNFDIAFTGIFLGMTLIFQYLSKFMPLVPGLLNINLSLIFILIVFIVSGMKFGTIALMLRYILGMAMDGFNPINAIGHTILLIAGIIYIALFMLFRKLRIINNKLGMYIGLTFITLLSSFIMTMLNGILFVPAYMVIYDPALGFHIGGHDLPWGNAYWPSIFAIYITGNLINYGVASFVAVPILKVVNPKLKEIKN